MKIRKIKYLGHPVLDDLELDLVNPTTGVPYSNIVFAGENGTGKTSILSSLSTFLNKRSFEYFERIEYEIQGGLYAAEPLDGGMSANFGYHKRINLDTGDISNVNSGVGNNENRIAADIEDLRHYGCIFTKARADYSSNAIKGATASELDNSIYDTDSNDDFTSLKQLIVDVDTQDSRDVREALDQAPTRFDYETFKQTTKMTRFRNAFDGFFENLKYKCVRANAGSLNVIFEKHGREIQIDNLSTGEKQIVYRGIYLLRNLEKIDGAAIMIDEPELSMHPKWQKRILKYFKDLFTDDDGNQKVQLFFATHSEYVLAEALKDRDHTLVIILQDNGGSVVKKEVTSPLLLPTLVASEVNYVAFDIPSTDYHIALFGAIQAKYQKRSVYKCDRFIKNQCVPYYDATIHECITSYGGATYNTLPSKIRNHIDHPDNPYSFTDEELEISIKLMRSILENII